MPGSPEQRDNLMKSWWVVLVILVSVFWESADMSVLGGLFKVFEEHIPGATPTSLGSMVLLETLGFCVTAPIWGFYADRMDRFWLLSLSLGGISVFSLLTAFCSSITSLCAVRMSIGMFKGGVAVTTQGLIVAFLDPLVRGKVFGATNTVCIIGAFTGQFFSASLSHVQVFNHAGWRVILIGLSLATAIFAMLVRLLAGRTMGQSQSLLRLPSAAGKRDAWSEFRYLLSIPSVQLMILAGLSASAAGSALHFCTMWFQYLGFSDSTAPILVGCLFFGAAVGSFAAGITSDYLAANYPDHGRVVLGQVGDVGKILVLLIGWISLGIPDTGNSGYRLYAMGVLLGFYGFWGAVAYTAQKPILTEIVPPSIAASALAYCSAIDHCFAAVFGSALVGQLAERFYGYRPSTVPVVEMAEELRKVNAVALGSALTSLVTVCVIITLILFSALHLTYAADRDNAKEAWRLERETQKLAGEGSKFSEASDLTYAATRPSACDASCRL